MTKYKIYKLETSDGEWFYCKEKFGPFWITPRDYNLSISTVMATGKNSRCRRFKTKEALLEAIFLVRQKELESETYSLKMKGHNHIPLEII